MAHTPPDPTTFGAEASSEWTTPARELAASLDSVIHQRVGVKRYLVAVDITCCGNDPGYVLQNLARVSFIGRVRHIVNGRHSAVFEVCVEPSSDNDLHDLKRAVLRAAKIPGASSMPSTEMDHHLSIRQLQL